MMNLLDRFYAFIMNWNLPKEDFDPDRVYCSVDDQVVDCDTWEETTYGN